MSEANLSEPTISNKLAELLIQATAEKSHYYVANVCREAIDEFRILRADNEKAKNEILALRRAVAKQCEALDDAKEVLEEVVEIYCDVRNSDIDSFSLQPTRNWLRDYGDVAVKSESEGK